MQAFSIYLKILKKNLGSVIIYLGIFLTVTVLFSSFGTDSGPDAFNMKKLDIAVLDRDNTQLSKGFKDYMGSIHNIVDVEDEVEKLQDNLYYRNITYILMIPKGYGEQLSSGNLENIVENVKVPNSYNGLFVDQQVNQYLKTLSSYLKSGVDAKKALTLTKESLSEATEVKMLDTKTTTSQPESNTMFFFFQYLAFVLINVLLVGLGPILLIFNKQDIKRRIDVSALSLRNKNKQLIFFSLFFSIAIWFCFMLLAFVINGIEIFSVGGLLCILNSFVFTIVCLSITYLVALLIKSNNAITIVSNVLGLGMSFLCGIFVPQSILSEQVLSVSRVLPGYWYMHAHNTIIEFTGSSAQVRTIIADLGILFGFAIVILAISLVISKLKKENA